MTLSDWKAMAITQEFLAELKRRMETCAEELLGSAGQNPVLDSYRSGVIAALKDVVEFHFEEDSA